MTIRPVIAIDVDGVLAPFGKPVEWNERHGAWLRKLVDWCDAELVWSTSWGHQANWEISPALGLPQLPVVETKPGTVAWGHPRPLVWIDDMFHEVVHPVLREALAGREHLLVGPDPHVGLLYTDIQEIHFWINGHR